MHFAGPTYHASTAWLSHVVCLFGIRKNQGLSSYWYKWHIIEVELPL